MSAHPRFLAENVYMTMWPSGTKYHHFAPDPDDTHIEDIAHHLSLICRFCGGVPFKYSVAQHSLYCVQVFQQRYRNDTTKMLRTLLLHDAAEAYWNDMHSGAKRNLPEYMSWLEDTERLIAEKYDCFFPLPRRAKKVDGIMLSTELVLLKGEKPYIEKPLVDFKFERRDDERVAQSFFAEWERLKPRQVTLPAHDVPDCRAC